MSLICGAAAPPPAGNATEDAKYFFKYPTGWKTDVINKTQKGTQVRARALNPALESQKFTQVRSALNPDLRWALSCSPPGQSTVRR